VKTGIMFLMTHQIGARFYVFPQTWLGRVGAGLLGVALLVPALFFLLVLLLVPGVLILGISLRLLWKARQVRAKASQGVLEGEFSVEPRVEAAEITHKS